MDASDAFLVIPVDLQNGRFGVPRASDFLSSTHSRAVDALLCTQPSTRYSTRRPANHGGLAPLLARDHLRH